MAGDETPDVQPERRQRLDPTKVTHQRALQTSDGRIWLLMGGLFTLAACAGFGMLMVTPDRQSNAIAWIAAGIIVALYLALVVAQFAIRAQRTRLRMQAACMLTMALVAVGGMYLAIVAEGVGG